MLKIKNPQGTTLKDFGFREEAAYFEELHWENVEMKRKIRKAQREDKANQTYIQDYIK